MNKRSITDGYLTVLKIEKIVKGRMPMGRVISLAAHRQEDMLGYVYRARQSIDLRTGTL